MGLSSPRAGACLGRQDRRVGCKDRQEDQEQTVIFDLHPAVSDLVELGRKRGWLSYEELNNTLPDEMVDPERLDEFLALMDRTGIEMVDELEDRGGVCPASQRERRGRGAQ